MCVCGGCCSGGCDLKGWEVCSEYEVIQLTFHRWCIVSFGGEIQDVAENW